MINNTLAYSTNIELILIYFECICKVFDKYWVSFKLDNCKFLKYRFKFVGHDILSDILCPAQSTFDIIKDWTLPSTGQSLHSFVGLINFYHNYAPYFEILLKPLRELYGDFLWKPNPRTAWTSDLQELFLDLKNIITYSPLLSSFDPAKCTFLKTDWSGDNMAWSLMQSAKDGESMKAAAHLDRTGECLFNMDLNGTRLRPVSYGSRASTNMERKFHSFVGETASGQWTIGRNRKYLWGCQFYWMCDCKVIE